MEKHKVAFLGPNASYTHQAALETFPSSSYELVPQSTIADVFHAVQSGAVHRGVVPFENSTNGTVITTLELFTDRKKELQNILVHGEAYIDVRHCLVGRLPHDVDRVHWQPVSHTLLPAQDRAPGSEEQLETLSKTISGIRRLYSHPQAWGQCEHFLSAHLKGVERIDASSTSRAAEIVAEENPVGSTDAPVSAAVSSETAARICGLDILATGIQDEASNITRFFVIRKQAPEEEPGSPVAAYERAQSFDFGAASADPSQPVITSTVIDRSAGYALGNPFAAPTFKTLVSFTVPHTSPGALAKSLAVFAEHGINLTSINTRPSLVEPWNYLFFVEMQGRREEHGRGAVNAALRDLSGVARGWRWLGSWEMQVDTAGDDM